MGAPSSLRPGDYAFADAVVRIDSREIFLRGRLEVVEPKTFDVIRYLIEHREKVVTKEELLKQIWREAVVSESAVAQSIMKARHALGDKARGQKLIKTVHRVGYRFQGQLLGAADSEPMPAARTDQVREPEVPPLGIAWLPTLDLSQRAEVAWASLGLVSVAAAVLNEASLRAFSIRRLLEIFDVGADALGYERQVDRAVQRAGAAAVVSSVLSHVSGNYVFEWSLQYTGKRIERRLVGPAPAELVLAAAHEVVAMLRPHGVARRETTSAGDRSFFRNLEARAQFASERQAMAKAQSLMAVCVEANKGSIALHAEFLLVLAQRSEPLVIEQAQKLIGRARLEKVEIYEGWAHACLMRFYQYDGEFRMATRHGDKALAVLRLFGNSLMLAKTLLIYAQDEIRMGVYASARERLDEAAAIERNERDPYVEAWIAQQRGIIEFQQGRLTEASGMLAEALAMAQAAHLHAHLGWNHVLLGMISAANGPPGRADAHFHAAVDAAGLAGVPRLQIVAHLQLGLHCLRTGDETHFASCIGLLSGGTFSRSDLARASALLLQGMQLFAQGSFQDAADALARSVTVLEPFPLWWRDEHWIALAESAVSAGSVDTARAVLHHLQGTECFETCAVKQEAARTIERLLADAAWIPFPA